jgi:hypothetical protein
MDVDIVGVANEMMISMAAPMSPLLAAIELVVFMMPTDYSTPLMTLGVLSLITLVEAHVNISSSS